MRLRAVLDKERTGQQSAIHPLATLGASAQSIASALDAKYATEPLAAAAAATEAMVGSKRKTRSADESGADAVPASKRVQPQSQLQQQVWTETQKVLRAQILANLESQRKR